MNYNVRLSLWWTVLENISGSIRSGDGLSAYIFLLTKTNSAVGLVQGINGILQLVVSMPAGWLADRTRRDWVLRIGAIVGFCGFMALIMAMSVSWNSPIAAVVVAMALLGSYRGIYNPALEALFADSVETGRTGPYTWRYVLMISSTGIGPLVSASLFFFMHSFSWSERDCQNVVLAGTALMIPALILMCFFNDDKALSHRSEALTEPLLRGPIISTDRLGSPDMNTTVPKADEDGEISSHQHGSDQESGTQPIVGSHHADGLRGTQSPSESLPPLVREHDTVDAPDAMHERDSLVLPTRTERWIGSCHWLASPSIAVPALLTLSDFIGALASGMTLRFFSLFFMQRVKFDPIHVSLVSAASPFGISLASVVAQKSGKRIGRVQVSLITRMIDIVLLILLAKIPTLTDTEKRVLVAIHLSRMAFANCTRPLLRSVLNEFVAKRHRGKVNAIDSVRTFSWSGSAALGGFLIEKYGFEGTFMITAMVKIVSFVPLIFLLRFVSDGIGAENRISLANSSTSTQYLAHYGNLDSGDTDGEEEVDVEAR